jgi:type IV pilus assembly protein PilW
MCIPLSFRAERGFSLVEVMIALTISAFLGLGLVQVFSAQRAAYSSNESLARIQENSRFAMTYLQHDLRMTGNMACLNELGFQGRIYNHLSAGAPHLAPWAYRIDRPLEVFEYVGTAPGDSYEIPAVRTTPDSNLWQPPLPPDLGIVGEALDGSDVIVVRYLSPESAVLGGVGVNGATGEVEIADPDFVVANRVYAVSDCKNFSMFQAQTSGTNVQAGVGGLNLAPWTGRENNYGPDIPIHEYRFAAYYVGMGSDGGPAMFKIELDPDTGAIGAGQEIVAGVETLQVVLGADTSMRHLGDRPTQYFTATSVENGLAPWPASTSDQRWASVVNVRLGLMMRNNDLAAAVSPSVIPRVADTLVNPPTDARLRHTYEVQVALRNRIRG